MKVIVAVSVALGPALVACIGNSAPRPDQPTPTSPITFTELGAGGVATIATGGTQIISIPDPLAIGLSGATTASYELVPAAGAWPNAQQDTYTVRALAAGTGAFSIATAKGVAAGDVASADLDHVAIRPAAYQLDGTSAFAVAVDRPAIEAALFDVDADRLVDGSLAFAGTGVTATAWDTATLPTATGAYTVNVTADSGPAQTATIAVVTGYDRIEAADDGGRTCYHAYANTVEVAAVMTNVVSPDPNATNCELANE